MRIGILGATGPAGRGLATRLASVGHEVLFGSREAAKAAKAVGELRDRWGGRVDGLVPVENAGACDAPIVVLAVTAEAAIPTVEAHRATLSGRIVVSMANQLVRRGSEFNAKLPPHGSVAAEVGQLLPESNVVSAFHLVPAAELGELDHVMENDVVVVGDDPDAVRALCEVIRGIPNLRAFEGGSLANAAGMETFAAVLLTINLKNKARASLRLTGV